MVEGGDFGYSINASADKQRCRLALVIHLPVCTDSKSSELEAHNLHLTTIMYYGAV